jgi:ABC-type antimicrobial peptide transport system permease subunit
MGFAHTYNNFKYKGKTDIDLQVSVENGNEDFIPFYEMKLLAGRNFVHSDSLKELVINNTLSKRLGFLNPADAVGKILYGNKPYPIVGVVEDFHEGSFHEIIQPVVIENLHDRQQSIAIKLNIEDKEVGTKKILEQLEKQWKKIYPDLPFDYAFLDESITWLYEQEKKTEWLMRMATLITIFISCMGLFGLAMFTAQQKTKEIGIRKVLGASVMNIVTMLGREFFFLILTAILIASPIAWYFMNQWLQDFAYRSNISAWIFIVAGITAFAIAFFTVGIQAIKAAVVNPVKSLRTE